MSSLSVVMTSLPKRETSGKFQMGDGLLGLPTTADKVKCVENLRLRPNLRA